MQPAWSLLHPLMLSAVVWQSDKDIQGSKERCSGCECKWCPVTATRHCQCLRQSGKKWLLYSFERLINCKNLDEEQLRFSSLQKCTPQLVTHDPLCLGLATYTSATQDGQSYQSWVNNLVSMQ